MVNAPRLALFLVVLSAVAAQDNLRLVPNSIPVYNSGLGFFDNVGRDTAPTTFNGLKNFRGLYNEGLNPAFNNGVNGYLGFNGGRAGLINGVNSLYGLNGVNQAGFVNSVDGINPIVGTGVNGNNVSLSAGLNGNFSVVGGNVLNLNTNTVNGTNQTGLRTGVNGINVTNGLSSLGAAGVYGSLGTIGTNYNGIYTNGLYNNGIYNNGLYNSGLYTNGVYNNGFGYAGLDIGNLNGTLVTKDGTYITSRFNNYQLGGYLNSALFDGRRIRTAELPQSRNNQGLVSSQASQVSSEDFSECVAARCSDSRNQVCGADGRTHQNTCQLECAGVAFARDGQCSA